jgi:hypothetical protein
MRRFEGHQQGETKRDEAAFTESAAVKVRYVSLHLSTPSRHNRAIGLSHRNLAVIGFRLALLFWVAFYHQGVHRILLTPVVEPSADLATSIKCVFRAIVSTHSGSL